MAPSLPLTALACLHLAVFAAGLRSAEAPPPVPADAVFAFAVDRELIDGAMHAPPLAVWYDPAAATAVAHLQHELARLLDSLPDYALLAALLREGRWLRAYALPPSLDRRWDLLPMLIVDCGAARTALGDYREWKLANWVGRGWTPGVSMTIDGFVGQGMGKQFLGFLGFRGDGAASGLATDLMHILTPPSAPTALTAPEAAPLRMQLDLTKLALANQHDRQTMRGYAEIFRLFHAIWPGWRNAVARLSLRTTPALAGWFTTLELTGVTSMPLHAIGAEILAQARPGAQVTAAIGVRPECALKLLTGMAPSDADTQPLTTLTGLSTEVLATLFTGDVLVQGGWTAGPIPAFAVVLGLAKREAVDAALKALATRYGWEAHHQLPQAVIQEVITLFENKSITTGGKRITIPGIGIDVHSWTNGIPLPRGKGLAKVLGFGAAEHSGYHKQYSNAIREILQRIQDKMDDRQIAPEASQSRELAELAVRSAGNEVAQLQLKIRRILNAIPLNEAIPLYISSEIDIDFVRRRTNALGY